MQQMWEFLNPSMLQTMVTNTLHTAQSSNHSHGNNHLDSRQGKPFLGRPQEPQLSAGKEGTTNPKQTCCYCKDTGHELDNCLHLQCKKDFLVHSQGRVKLKAPTSGGHKGGAKVDPTVPPSPNTQFDDMFHTLVSNAVSLETKQRVMQRAISNCPMVTLDVQGKGVPSLLD